MKKYGFSEAESRFIKFALVSLQHNVRYELVNYENSHNHYLLLTDQLNACNDLIDKLRNWGI